MDYFKQSFEHYELTMLQTQKFKTNRIRITFANELNDATITSRALLPYLLRSASALYPTRKALSTKLEEMYAANLGVSVEKKGLTHILTYEISMINNRYTLNEENLLNEGLLFLNEILFNPLFEENILIEEKRLLDEYHKSIYANKMRFAMKEALASMYHGEQYNIGALGNQADISKITLDDIKDAYKSMIKNDVVNISIIGDINYDDMVHQLSQTLSIKNHKKELILLDKTPKKEKDITQLCSIQDVSQAKLVIGYQFPVYYGTDDYYKAVVLNSLLGGNTESLLFKRIREELSLVYFISSVYDNYKGTLLIYGGINKEEKDRTIKEIDQILVDLIDKNFDDKLLQISKTSIISSLIESYDSSGSLIKRINDLSLFNRDFDKDKIINHVNNTSKDDLARLAKLIKKDVVYILRNDNHDE